MCGLAGFARHPDGEGHVTAREVVEELLLRSAHRGKHATGIATVGGSKPFIWKWAVDVHRALNSEPWRNQRAELAADTPFMIGHVRYATQNNAHMDEAAHPFRFGRVVGAHNGVIRNWHSLREKHKTGADWIVDSEAAFALLDAAKDPNEALDLLDGYWALTWTKRGVLNVCRTSDAQLSVAYVPHLRTLFWCSERRILEAVLHQKFGQKAYECWEPRCNTLYQYNPAAFTESGTGAIVSDLTFRSKMNGKVDPRTQGGFFPAPPSVATGGVSTTTRPPRRTESGSKKAGKQRSLAAERAELLDGMESSGGVSMRGLANVCKRLANRLTELEIRLEETDRELELMHGRVESLEKEKEYLYEVLNEAGILDDFPEGEDDSDADSEARDAGHDPRQLSLIPRNARCGVCCLGSDDGELLELPGGEFIHEACVAADLERSEKRPAKLAVGLA
jgi:predicted glutamine amidotransferase